MIIHGCIEIHSKDCEGWIIITGFRVLLISQHLFPEILLDDRSWMYRDSPQGLRRMDYYNGVQGFINFTTSIPRNFTGGGIRYACKKCQNKKYLHPDVVTMHLLHKGFMKNY